MLPFVSSPQYENRSGLWNRVKPNQVGKSFLRNPDRIGLSVCRLLQTRQINDHQASSAVANNLHV
jgi:hypothetical protein